VPLEKIVLETDSPYLTPHPHRGKRNEPAYLNLIAQRLADIYDTDISTIADITTQNAKKVFKTR
jgi:TatD DNase family protein